MMEAWPLPQSELLWFALFFVGFCIAMVAMGIAVLMLLSFMSGWRSLARQFRSSVPPSGDRFRFATGSLGSRFFPVSYSNCLTLTVGGGGIHLAVLSPFRPFHPPLFIPSAMIESVVEKRSLFGHTRIRIRDHWPSLTIYGRAARRIVELHGRPDPRSNAAG
jgi:hypothetical protein